MAKRSVVLTSFIVLFCLVLTSCDERKPEGGQATATPPPVAVTAATDKPTAASATVITTTVSPTTTTTLSATATVSPTLPPGIVALLALNIRSGPGQDYPIVGYFAAGAAWEIRARSADGLWWKVDCPAGVASDECWITANETAVASVGTPAAPVAAAPPMPSATAAPTATPCVVAPGVGWTTYQVQAGDTLSSIAGRVGGSAGQIMAVNCLPSDTIVAGSSLWVPGAAASPAGAGSPTATDSAQDHAFAAGIAAALGFAAPGSMPCPAGRPQVSTTDLTVFIGERANLPKNTWEIAEGVCIYVVNATPGEPVTVTIRLPNGDERDADLLGGSTAPWTYIPKPGDPAGAELGYTATARQGNKIAAAVFHVTRASEPRVRVLPPQDVSPGDGVNVVVAGWPSGAPLYLYAVNSSKQQPCAVASAASLVCGDGAEPAESEHFCLVEQLPHLNTDQHGEAAFVVWTRNRPPDTYLLHDGRCEEIGLSDVRLFSILEP